MTPEEREKRLEEIRRATPSDDRAIWQERQFLLAELDRVTAERDSLARALRRAGYEELGGAGYDVPDELCAALAQRDAFGEELEIRNAEKAAALSQVEKLREALRNTLAILLTYDVSEQHGVVLQARAALATTEKRP